MQDADSQCKKSRKQQIKEKNESIGKREQGGDHKTRMKESGLNRFVACLS